MQKTFDTLHDELLVSSFSPLITETRSCDECVWE
jgi:hypothetical protein